MQHKHWKRQQREFEVGQLAWVQRNQDSNISPALPSEQEYYEQMYMDSVLYDVMERGIR